MGLGPYLQTIIRRILHVGPHTCHVWNTLLRSTVIEEELALCLFLVTSSSVGGNRNHARKKGLPGGRDLPRSVQIAGHVQHHTHIRHLTMFTRTSQRTQPSTARPSLLPFHARKSKNTEPHYAWGKVYGETYGSGSSEPCGADVAKVVSPPSPSNSLKE
jgi:hypothetical protein